jgi:hypothetical protein
VPSKIKTAGVERMHATTYFRKAVQFCEAAAEAYAQERYDAAWFCRFTLASVLRMQLVSVWEPERAPTPTSVRPIFSKRPALTPVISRMPPNGCDSC